MDELQELYKLKESLIEKKDNLLDKIKEVSEEIDALIDQDRNTLIKEHPYFKDKSSILYITRQTSIKFIITKITYNIARVVGINTFASDNIDFLKSFKPATKLDWDRAITELNAWLSDANVKLIEANVRN